MNCITNDECIYTNYWHSIELTAVKQIYITETGIHNYYKKK
jgi:hypothetical protein